MQTTRGESIARHLLVALLPYLSGSFMPTNNMGIRRIFSDNPIVSSLPLTGNVWIFFWIRYVDRLKDFYYFIYWNFGLFEWTNIPSFKRYLQWIKAKKRLINGLIMKCVFDNNSDHNRSWLLTFHLRQVNNYAIYKSVYCNLIISSHVPVAESM